MLAIETRGLTKRYADGPQALSEIDLDVRQGEVFALLGPNGAGKTTWISIVCGLTRATAGTARVLGHSSGSLPARRAVGLVPQEIALDAYLTVEDVLRIQMGYFGMRRDDARVEELLVALSLHDKRASATSALSGGMKRRLVIAKALVHAPRVVFLDEPTAGVDLVLRHELWQYVRTLRDRGTTIVLTTHYLEEAEALADRVGVIDGGRLVAIDTPRSLVANQGGKRVVITFAEAVGLLPGALSDLGATLSASRTEVSCSLSGRAGAAIDLGRVVAASAELNRLHRIVDLRTEQPTLEEAFTALVSR